ncbi:MAG TPA: hydrolase [Firmicutes bacterium]|nr:hydrolase [Bacillota bacterium]
MLHHRYYTDPFLTQLSAEVVDARPMGDTYHVVLTDTIFYPTGGGQPHDTGWIDAANVLDVFEEGGQVIHVVDKPVPPGPVTLRLNWERRFYHMQHHTGQHLLSAVFANEYGWATAGFHLGENYTTIDITTPHAEEHVLAQVEQAVNGAIYKDLPIKVYTAEREEAAALPLRKMPTVDTGIRIVEILGYDYSPCGGTHLESTGQIGLLKIIKAEKYKGMTRVYFLCGERAFADYSLKHKLVQDLSNTFSTAVPELAAKVQGEVDLRRSLEAEVQNLQNRVFHYVAKELTAKARGKFIHHVLESDSVDEAQSLARHITAQGEYFAAIEAGSRVVLAHSLENELHVGKLIQEHARPLEGKGGGSPQMAQVFFNDLDNLRKFRLFLQDYGEQF